MQNKGAIRLFAILLALACVYYMLFTYVTSKVERQASAYATKYTQRPDVEAAAEKFAGQDPAKKLFYLDSIAAIQTDNYLDSVKKKVVYSIGITKFTYEDCKEQEINLGLDLRGGMNVTLQISEGDIIRQMSNYSPDKVFNQALADAQQQFGRSEKDFVTLFGENYKRLDPAAHLASNFQTIELKGKIDFHSSDETVLAFIRERVAEAIETSEKTLRSRID